MKLKVLMFGWEFPPHHAGGLGVACYGLANALSKSGVSVCFVLPRRIEARTGLFETIFAESSGSVREEQMVFPSAYATSGFSLKKPMKDRAFFALMDEVKRYASEAARIAMQREFDVIHAHDWLSFEAGMESKEASGKPLVVHIHATEIDRSGGRGVNEHVYNIERRAMAKADAVIAVSKFTKNILIERYDVPEQKIHVAYNGVDIQESRENPLSSLDLRWLKDMGKNIVLFVGRLTLQKGPDYFLKMAELIASREPNAVFVIAGVGDMQEQLIDMASRMGLSDRVFFVGFLGDEELKNLYRFADAFVMPSVSEPFGIVGLEAASQQAPVIFSRQSGVAEVISHALRADFWDVEELANKAVALLRYRSLKEVMAANGSREVSRFNWDRCARDCIRVYRDLVPAL